MRFDRRSALRVVGAATTLVWLLLALCFGNPAQIVTRAGAQALQCTRTI